LCTKAGRCGTSSGVSGGASHGRGRLTAGAAPRGDARLRAGASPAVSAQYHVGELEREKDHADGKNDNP
jgi:hypothetical protein